MKCIARLNFIRYDASSFKIIVQTKAIFNFYFKNSNNYIFEDTSDNLDCMFRLFR